MQSMSYRKGIMGRRDRGGLEAPRMLSRIVPPLGTTGTDIFRTFEKLRSKLCKVAVRIDVAIGLNGTVYSNKPLN